MNRAFNQDPEFGDNNPTNIHQDHALWSNPQIVEWLKFSATQLVNTEVQRSALREAAKRIEHYFGNPRFAEQDCLRLFVKIAESLDDYCMGGTNQKHTIQDIRHLSNDAANQARALLDMFPKSPDCAAKEADHGKA